MIALQVLQVLGDFRHGQTFRIDGALVGQVVFSSFSRSYALDFPQEKWPADQYDGVLIRQDDGALIFSTRKCFIGPNAEVEVLA